MERGDQQRAGRRPVRRAVGPGLDQRLQVVHDVEIARLAPRQAAVADRAALVGRVARQRVGAGPAERRVANRRQRLAD